MAAVVQVGQGLGVDLDCDECLLLGTTLIHLTFQKLHIFIENVNFKHCAKIWGNRAEEDTAPLLEEPLEEKDTKAGNCEMIC